MEVKVFQPAEDTLNAVPGTRFHYNKDMAKTISFVEQEQLLNRNLWKLFVQQYRIRDDSNNYGWRGEYWGKMMMGACFLCEATGNDALYAVLEETVRDMLTTQDHCGRIATYDIAHEFHGWDIWNRKYVMIGMEYFFDICKDEALKTTILQSLCHQMNALTDKFGPGKKPVCLASDLYRGLNSCSILEAIVRLYRMTGETEYLNFALDIAKSGGSSICDLFTLALQDELKPYQYPVTKAYEMISCFEGLLELYRVTGDENCKIAALNYTNRILDSDFTVIGSCGCTHEFLDHSTVRQAKEETGPLMEETCVTISILKMLYQAAKLTGAVRYVDAFEISFYNAYLGTFNTKHHTQTALLNEDPALHLKALPFDSYSPLTAGYRGRAVGGFQIMRDHEFYGCCACIASTGSGLFPKMQLMKAQNALVLNLYTDGTITTVTPHGNPLKICIDTDYPADGIVTITMDPAESEQFAMRLRIPAWSNSNPYWYYEAVNELRVLAAKYDMPDVCIYYYGLDRVFTRSDCQTLQNYIANTNGIANVDPKFFAAESYSPSTTLFATTNTDNDTSGQMLMGFCTKMGRSFDPVLIFFQVSDKNNSQLKSVISLNSGIDFFIKSRDTGAVLLSLQSQESTYTNTTGIYTSNSGTFPLTYEIRVTSDSLRDGLTAFYKAMQTLWFTTIPFLLILTMFAVFLSYKPVRLLVKEMEPNERSGGSEFGLI